MKIVYIFENESQPVEVAQVESFAEGIQYLHDHHQAAFLSDQWKIINHDILPGTDILVVPTIQRSHEPQRF